LQFLKCCLGTIPPGRFLDVFPVVVVAVAAVVVAVAAVVVYDATSDGLLLIGFKRRRTREARLPSKQHLGRHGGGH